MIHPSSVISEHAVLGTDVDVGPFAVIEANVELGDGARVGPHVHLSGHTRIGAGVRIHAGAVVGDEPQDYSFEPGTISYTEIGERTIIREYVTIHRGAAPESRTVIGADCMLMGFAHVGHNCRLGDGVVIANSTLLAGHVEMERRANISANAAFHQFVRVGEFAMVTARATCKRDVAPYCLLGRGNRIFGPNVVGLKRGDIPSESRQAIRDAVKRLFFGSGVQAEILNGLERDYPCVPEVQHLIAFVRASKRGLMTARPRDE